MATLIGIESFKMNTKIFQIGFNRTATTSLWKFFENNGLKSIHWNEGHLVDQMVRNMHLNVPLLSNSYVFHDRKPTAEKLEDIVFFSDMTRELGQYDAKDFYKQLDHDYPGSKFILNTRDVNSWIESRWALFNGKTARRWALPHYGLKDTPEGVETLNQIWRNMHENHHQDVVKYFSNRPKDLLIYDINLDTPEKIVDFLSDHYTLKAKHWGVHNKSKGHFT